ncbi:MAG: hypothetical protein FGM32_07530 [Candidatus Kapabacteria bacterium]|nr:hypothetical protein [Candidatus Kapabacteria bacterium]
MQSRRILIVLIAASAVAQMIAQYSGTGSVTQGVGTVGTPNLFVCPKGRPTNLGRSNHKMVGRGPCRLR